jgi:hypothetical protein
VLLMKKKNRSKKSRASVPLINHGNLVLMSEEVNRIKKEF